MNRAQALDYRDPRWLAKRASILKQRNYTCERCGVEPATQVHHLCYWVGRRAWEARDDELEALCVRCHEIAHETPTYFDVWGPTQSRRAHAKRRSCSKRRPEQLELPLSFYGPMRSR